MGWACLQAGRWGTKAGTSRWRRGGTVKNLAAGGGSSRRIKRAQRAEGQGEPAARARFRSAQTLPCRALPLSPAGPALKFLAVITELEEWLADAAQHSQHSSAIPTKRSVEPLGTPLLFQFLTYPAAHRLDGKRARRLRPVGRTGTQAKLLQERRQPSRLMAIFGFAWKNNARRGRQGAEAGGGGAEWRALSGGAPTRIGQTRPRAAGRPRRRRHPSRSARPATTPPGTARHRAGRA